MHIHEKMFLGTILEIANMSINDNTKHLRLIECISQCNFLVMEYGYTSPKNSILPLIDTLQNIEMAKCVAKSINTLVHKYLFLNVKQKEKVELTDATLSFKFNKKLKKIIFSIHRAWDCDELCFTIDMITFVLLNIHTEPKRFKVCPHCGKIFYQHGRKSQKYCSKFCSDRGRSGKQYIDTI
jgi:hypothetical protein